MARGPEIPCDVRILIVKWVEEGLSYAEIGRRIERDRSTVRKFYKRYLATSQITSAPRPGGPSKVSERDCRALVREAKKNLRATSEELTVNFNVGQPESSQVKPWTSVPHQSNRMLHK
jgi:transposase